MCVCVNMCICVCVCVCVCIERGRAGKRGEKRRKRGGGGEKKLGEGGRVEGLDRRRKRSYTFFWLFCFSFYLFINAGKVKYIL